jgi:hypothetical protein
VRALKKVLAVLAAAVIAGACSQAFPAVGCNLECVCLSDAGSCLTNQPCQHLGPSCPAAEFCQLGGNDAFPD